MEYEGLSTICFDCGVYGHLKDQCKKNAETKIESVKSGNTSPSKQDNVAVLDENYGP